MRGMVHLKHPLSYLGRQDPPERSVWPAYLNLDSFPGKDFVEVFCKRFLVGVSSTKNGVGWHNVNQALNRFDHFGWNRQIVEGVTRQTSPCFLHKGGGGPIIPT